MKYLLLSLALSFIGSLLLGGLGALLGFVAPFVFLLFGWFSYEETDDDDDDE